MSTASPNKDDVLKAIQLCAHELAHSPSRSEFFAHSGINEHHVLKHFDSWTEAVRAAGFVPNTTNRRISEEDLLDDWGQVVRSKRQIPTRPQYRREGKYSPDVFEKRFGPWSAIPNKFLDFANNNPQWADVITLLPVPKPKSEVEFFSNEASEMKSSASQAQPRHLKLTDRPTYGNPIDFRGLRHEPVNENGVVFLFGIVARELGYSVEAVQAGFPDCEAKRQVAVGRWQRVRIEFEFESRNFREHGHSPDGCDLIICWRHNWPECPSHIEVVELRATIETLAKSDT